MCLEAWAIRTLQRVINPSEWMKCEAGEASDQWNSDVIDDEVELTFPLCLNLFLLVLFSCFQVSLPIL